MLPAFSFGTVGKENPHFNRLTTPSCVGYLTEYFRTQVPGVLRSMHATHSLAARGRLAAELVCDHYLDETPVGKNSPLAKLPQYNGKILFLGCSTDRNTSMHGVEELCTPPYLFLPERTTYYLLDGEGGCIERESLCHNFVVNGKHIDQRYSRIAELLPEDKIKRGKILDADCVLMDSAAVWEIGAARLAEDPYYFVEI